MEETISLQEILNILRKRLSLILIFTFISVGIAGIFTFTLIDPLYKSSSQLIVKLPASEGNNVINPNDLSANLQMIKTYKDIITRSNVVADESKKMLAEEDDIQLTAEEIKSLIDVEQEPDSQMFTINVVSKDPYVSEAVVNAVATVFQKEAKEIINVDKISIIATGEANLKPVSPNNALNILSGAFLGMVFGIILAFLLEYFDKTVKDEIYVTEVLGFPILGSIPEMNEKELKTDYLAKGGYGYLHDRAEKYLKDDQEDMPRRQDRERL